MRYLPLLCIRAHVGHSACTSGCSLAHFNILINDRSLTPPIPLISRASFAVDPDPFGGILPLPTCMAECVRPSMQPIHLQLEDIHGHMQTNMISAGMAVFTAAILCHCSADSSPHPANLSRLSAQGLDTIAARPRSGAAATSTGALLQLKCTMHMCALAREPCFRHALAPNRT